MLCVWTATHPDPSIFPTTREDGATAMFKFVAAAHRMAISSTAAELGPSSSWNSPCPKKTHPTQQQHPPPNPTTQHWWRAPACHHRPALLPLQLADARRQCARQQPKQPQPTTPTRTTTNNPELKSTSTANAGGGLFDGSSANRCARQQARLLGMYLCTPMHHHPPTGERYRSRAWPP